MDNFKVIIVEDVPLELKGTEGIFRNEIPEAEIIGTAENETAYWRLIKQQQPDLVLLDLGLNGSTTIGVEICRQTKDAYPKIKVLIFTGEILNEKLWVDVLDAGCDGICLKSGELLTRGDVQSVMSGKRMVFNQPILEKILARFRRSVLSETRRQEAVVDYDIDEYDYYVGTKKEGYIKLNKIIDETEKEEILNKYNELGLDVSIDEISTMVSESLTKNAVYSLLISFIAMIIYIAIRFSFSSNSSAFDDDVRWSIVIMYLITCCCQLVFQSPGTAAPDSCTRYIYG